MREFFEKIKTGVIVVTSSLLVGAIIVDIANYRLRPTTDSVVEVLVRDKGGNPLGHGSGSYIGDGWYLTASHVAKGTNSIVIKHQNGVEVNVADIKLDEKRDVALLFVGAEPNLIPSATLYCGIRNVGEDVYAKGYPMDLGLVETKGVISSKPTEWNRWQNVYRTDVALGPGMSGGPVFDNNGFQVGVNVGVALMPIGFGATTFGVNLIVPSKEVCDFKKELNLK